jgi:multiple antibiotic resistance protein
MQSYGQILITLFSVLNPLVAIPLYLDTVRHFTTREKTLILSSFGISMFSVMAISFFAGGPLLNSIGIHDYSLRIGGGLIVLIIAISIVISGSSADKHGEITSSSHDKRKNIIGSGVSPLAIPVVIGPGSIILVILYSQQASSLQEEIYFLVVFLVLSLGITLLFAISNLIYKIIGDIGLVILSKLMGLVLAAVAIELILQGLQLARPFLLAKL